MGHAAKSVLHNMSNMIPFCFLIIFIEFQDRKDKNKVDQ